VVFNNTPLRESAPDKRITSQADAVHELIRMQDTLNPKDQGKLLYLYNYFYQSKSLKRDREVDCNPRYLYYNKTKGYLGEFFCITTNLVRSKRYHHGYRRTKRYETGYRIIMA
jgi:hypothetical protein